MRRIVSILLGLVLLCWQGVGAEEKSPATCPTAFAFSPDGKVLAVGLAGGTVCLLATTDRHVLRRLSTKSDVISSLAYSPDGLSLAAASYDRAVRIWDLKTGQVRVTTPVASDEVLWVGWSPRGKTFAYGSYDDKMHLADVTTGQDVAQLTGHCGAFSPDGSLLVTGNVKGTVDIYDLATDKLVRSQPGNQKSVNTITFSADGKYFAVGGGDHIVRLFGVQGKDMLKAYEGHTMPITGVHFTPDGQRLLSSALDGTVKVWDRASGQLVKSLNDLRGATMAMDVDARAHEVVAANAIGLTAFWSLPDGKRLAVLKRATWQP